MAASPSPDAGSDANPPACAPAMAPSSATSRRFVVLAVAGADAETFLQGQLSCDVRGLAPDACRYGSFNSPKGRMLANFALWRSRRAAERFDLLLPADIAEPVARRLRMYVLRSKVTLTDVSAETCRFGVGGPRRRGRFARGAGTDPGAASGRCTPVRRPSSGFPARASCVLAPADAAPRLRARLEGRGVRNRLRRLAVAHHSRRRAGHHRRDAGHRSSRRPRTGTSWAASISRRAATPGRRSSPGRSTSAGSRSVPSCSTPICPTSRPGTGSSARPSTTSPAARSSTRRRRPAADAICSRCCRSTPRHGATRGCASPTVPACGAAAALRHPAPEPAARAPRLTRNPRGYAGGGARLRLLPGRRGHGGRARVASARS